MHAAVDTLGNLLTLLVTPANEQDRAQVGPLAAAVPEVTGQSVELAYVDQGYTGDDPAAEARQQGIQLEVVKLPEAKRGFVLLPRRWVMERTFAWIGRSRRMSKDYEYLTKSSESMVYLVMIRLMLRRLVKRADVIREKGRVRQAA